MKNKFCSFCIKKIERGLKIARYFREQNYVFFNNQVARVKGYKNSSVRCVQVYLNDGSCENPMKTLKDTFVPEETI